MTEQPSKHTSDPASKLDNLRQEAVHEWQDLVRFETDVERLAQDEAALISAYLKDDLIQAKSFWTDLKADMAFWETQAGRWLLQAAEPAATDSVKLYWQLHSGADVLLAGEMARDAHVRCLGCGRGVRVTGQLTLELCPECQSPAYLSLPLSGESH